MASCVEQPRIFCVSVSPRHRYSGLQHAHLLVPAPVLSMRFWHPSFLLAASRCRSEAGRRALARRDAIVCLRHRVDNRVYSLVRISRLRHGIGQHRRWFWSRGSAYLTTKRYAGGRPIAAFYRMEQDRWWIGRKRRIE